MNKTAIKNFAVAARKKLISEITYKAGLVGITKDGIADPVHQAEGIQMYDIGGNEPYTIKGDEIKERESLVARVKDKGFAQVIEEVAYTWFNRIIAVRFMEVNDYLPTRVRVLSSETKDKTEPDIVTEALIVELGFTANEMDEIVQLKHDNKLDELFRMLFIKQCNVLNEILPDLFEKTADYTELLLHISFTNEDSIIRELINSIDEEDFKEQVEIIGWMYQYYNTELKDDTFALLKKNVKITKERIPAATQLFTPDWIVRYMVENSLGRLWLEGHPDSDIKEKWKYYLDEAEQNPDVKVQLEALRADAKNIKPEDIKVIDPCMGSGHILVYAFDVLMDIYKSCGYAEREAAKLILKYNLYGIDIDDRAYQFAYFAVMMKARGYSRRIFSEGVKPQLCAIQESNSISQVLNAFVANNDGNLMAALQYITDVFKEAKEFGSILDVECGMQHIELLLKRIEDIKNADYSSDLIGLMYKEETLSNLYPIIKQAEIMVQKYDVVVTNPPYMGSGGMGVKLAQYLKVRYPHSKLDLFAVFIEKCGKMVKVNGLQAMITQHAFMFLKSYEKLREMLMLKSTINMAHLGARAFEEISGEVVQSTSFVLRNSKLKAYKATYIRLVDYDNAKLKEEKFLQCENKYITQKEIFLKIPGMPIAYWVSKKIYSLFQKCNTIRDYGEPRHGMSTGNNDVCLKLWFEVNKEKIAFNCVSKHEFQRTGSKWIPYNKGGAYRKWYGNNDYVIAYDEPSLKYMTNLSGYRSSSINYFFRPSINWSDVSSSYFGVRYSYCGFAFDGRGASMFTEQEYEKYLLAVLCCKFTSEILKVMNPTLTFNIENIASVPVIIDNSYKNKIENIANTNINISCTDWDSFEISWDFKKHPLIKNKTKISDCFAEWQQFTENQFTQLKANEEELNRIFIEIYGLQDELTPEIEEKDVTIRKANLERDIKSFISYAVGCTFGRYSLDVDCIAYAGGDWDNSKYKTFIPDADNIIPITDEEYFTDDIVGRFMEFVKVAFGTETLEQNLDFIANALGNKGNTSREIIRNYFIKDFYKDHIKTYQKKPIYWLFDSGKENGFKALIYMHRYHPDTVGKVRADYLHKTQKAIESGIARADMVIESAANPMQKVKAVKDKEKLVKQLAETRIYDAAIGHIAAQRIDIDLDDGVTVNYAKFQGVEISSEGKKASKIDLLGKI